MVATAQELVKAVSVNGREMNAFLVQPCLVCDGMSKALDVVDLNKSCEEYRGKFLPLSGYPVYYALCEQCGFCFAPELSSWSLQDFADRIYNDQYVLVDPDYVETRPHNNAANISQMFGDTASSIRHLDYGGGNGLLSRVLSASGWESSSYDPFVQRDLEIETLGKFDLITAFEVFEHAPDPRKLISDLSALLVQDGLIVFTTLISDKQITAHARLTWWYASPRNGHISLFSRDSLATLGAMKQFSLGSFSEGFHAFWRTVPAWASHVINQP